MPKSRAELGCNLALEPACINSPPCCRQVVSKWEAQGTRHKKALHLPLTPRSTSKCWFCPMSRSTLEGLDSPTSEGVREIANARPQSALAVPVGSENPCSALPLPRAGVQNKPRPCRSAAQEGVLEAPLQFTQAPQEERATLAPLRTHGEHQRSGEGAQTPPGTQWLLSGGHAVIQQEGQAQKPRGPLLGPAPNATPLTGFWAESSFSRK